MEENSKEKEQELVTKTYLIIQRIEKLATCFNHSMLILSILDCIFGVLAIFCTSLALTAFFASATSLTAITICGKVIQVSKIRKLSQSLKPVNLIALGWFVNKYRRFIKTKKEKKEKMKDTKLSKIQICAIIGAVLGIAFAIVSIFVPNIAIAGDSIYNILVATGIESLCAIAGTFKGYSQMTKEEIDKIKAKKEEREQAKLEKEAKRELEAEARAKQIADEEAAALREKEASEALAKAKEAKAEAEHKAKVEAIKAKLIAEENAGK